MFNHFSSSSSLCQHEDFLLLSKSTPLFNDNVRRRFLLRRTSDVIWLMMGNRLLSVIAMRLFEQELSMLIAWLRWTFSFCLSPSHSFPTTSRLYTEEWTRSDNQRCALFSVRKLHFWTCYWSDHSDVSLFDLNVLHVYSFFFFLSLSPSAFKSIIRPLSIRIFFSLSLSLSSLFEHV